MKVYCFIRSLIVGVLALGCCGCGFSEYAAHVRRELRVTDVTANPAFATDYQVGAVYVLQEDAMLLRIEPAFGTEYAATPMDDTGDSNPKGRGSKWRRG